MKSGIFIGICTEDAVFYTSEQAPTNGKIKVGDYQRYVGGPATNAAVTYALLGGKSHLFTVLGSSPRAELIKKELAEYGVTVTDIADGLPLEVNCSAIIVNPDNGDRGIVSGQPPLPSGLSLRAEELADGAFCMYDCNLPSVTPVILSAIRLSGLPLVLDAGSIKSGSMDCLKQADEVIASAAFGSNIGKDVFDLADLTKNLAKTDGGYAVRYREKDGEIGSFMPPKVDVVDTLGAGDVYHGAYCFFRYQKGLDFKNALIQAAEVAALSVAYRGAREGVFRYSRGKLGD